MLPGGSDPFGQNGGVSQWAGIESDTGPARRPAAEASDDHGGTAPERPRLRRADRLVVGSIDGAAHVLQREARGVLLGVGVLMLPLVTLGVLLSVLAYREFDSVESLLGDKGYLGAETGLFMVVLLVQSLTAHVAGAYAAAYLIGYQLGGRPGMGATLMRVVRRLPLLLITWLLTHWWLLLLQWALLQMERSAAAGLAWFLAPAFAFGSALVLFTVPVMMGEHLGVRAIRRGITLVRSRLGSAFAFVFATGLLGWVLLVFIAALPSLAESTGLLTLGRFRWLFQGVAAQVALLVVVPFSALATAQFYLQVRIHAEGLDIVMAADDAFGGRR